MKKFYVIVILLVLSAGWISSVAAEGLPTVPFNSMWDDYRAAVPDGWKTTFDNEGEHHTNTVFKNRADGSSLSIRWFTNYSTHRQVDGSLEMYGNVDDFIRQLSTWFGDGYIIEQAHEITVSGGKAKRFAGRLNRLPQGQSEDMIKDQILTRRARLGGMVDDSTARNGGRQALTVLAARSGFYVLSYFAPEEDFVKNEKFYDQMLASFVLLKDGPGGAQMPGSTSNVETADQKLQRYLSMLRSQRDQGIAGTADLRKKVIEFVSTMKQPPAVSGQAQRYFIQGNVIMKAATTSADYNLAINKYSEALTEAPWWGDPYYNLAKALNSAGQADSAKQAMELYITTKPKDVQDAQKMIYEIEAQQELQKEREAEIKAKYGAGQGSGFGWEALFRYGAIVKNMSFDASGNERTISLKIITRKEYGLLKNYFQIADITSRYDTFLQKFSMDWRGSTTFFLDDRTNPNKELMTLAVTAYGDGDANISIKPADNASASIQTSLTSLLRERARQAVYAGDKQTIGGKEFYVLGQGGAKGALLFFPVEIKGLLENGSARDLMPTLVANVNYRGSDGSNQNYTNTDLGEVGGTHYHLEHNGTYFEPKAGRGEDH